MAASANAGDNRVDRRIGKIAGDFLCRGANMDGDIGRVFELARHPASRRFGDQLGGAGDGALHALFARREVKRGTIGEHQPPPLDRHRFRHDEDELIALDRCHHGKANAGVAAGRLDDGATGFQAAIGFGRLDHRQRDPVLDRAAGVGAFGFDPDFGIGEQL